MRIRRRFITYANIYGITYHKLSVKATAFSIPLAHLTIHRHKSLLAINDDI